MAGKLNAQKYIFKIHSDRLKKAKWNLTLTVEDARKNDEVISIGDSLVLRWIDELNGCDNTEEKVRKIKANIRQTKDLPYSEHNRLAIRRMYDQLDELQFKTDYMHLVIDRNADMYRACRGFKINGIKYVRLLGTSGGVKCSTIVFVSERLASALRERIENGRNADIPQIPAKLEAYRALTCSGSVPVSMPRGILVVPDCETTFREDVRYLSDDGSEEPKMEYIRDYEFTLDESDGYGLMLPSVAERWSAELGLGYTAGAFNTRLSFEKGMLFAFDFVEFADRVAGTRIVHDAWGNEVDISTVEIVLTTSMLKLWKCYDSIDNYLECCKKNHYTFGITKIAPETLENRRSLNLIDTGSAH